MITNKKDQMICDMYSAFDDTGQCNCHKCPLFFGDRELGDFRCKCNSHQNKKTKEWELDQHPPGEAGGIIYMARMKLNMDTYYDRLEKELKHSGIKLRDENGKVKSITFILDDLIKLNGNVVDVIKACEKYKKDSRSEEGGE